MKAISPPATNELRFDEGRRLLMLHRQSCLKFRLSQDTSWISASIGVLRLTSVQRQEGQRQDVNAVTTATSSTALPLVHA